MAFGTGIAVALIGIVIGAFFLWLSARVFKLHDKGFMTPLTISAIVGVVGYVLGMIPFLNTLSWIVTVVLGVWLIKDRYHVPWGKAILVWLVYVVLLFAAMYVMMALFFGTMMAGFGMMPFGMMR